MASHKSQEPVSVTLIGAGQVGLEVVRQLHSTKRLTSLFRVDVLANSRYSLHIEPSAQRDVDSILRSLPKSSASAPPSGLPSGYEVKQSSLQQLIDSVVKTSSSDQARRLFVDCTSNQTVSEAYPAILGAGVHIVTPNKKATSSSDALYKSILEASEKSGALYYGEATVGAGLPILIAIKDLLETGDEVYKLEGILSGTLSYIFNTYSTPKGAQGKFTDVVKIAKQEGYTEPNPADDLSGSDVARKLTILSRLVAPQITLPEGFESVPTEPLVPAELLSISSADEFMSKLDSSSADADYAQKQQAAEKNGRVLRYVGSVDVRAGTAKCGLQEYSNSHPFATLAGAYNILSITTKRYGESAPLIIQGSGAGAAVTAMGVVADAIRVAERT